MPKLPSIAEALFFLSHFYDVIIYLLKNKVNKFCNLFLSLGVIYQNKENNGLKTNLAKMR
jgi:hypothetical protein